MTAKRKAAWSKAKTIVLVTILASMEDPTALERFATIAEDLKAEP